MRRFVSTLLALACTCGVAAAQTAKPSPPAKPQPPARPAQAPARVRKPPFKPAFPYFLSVNGGYQPTANDFADSASFSEYQESAHLDAEYEVKGGPAVNVSGGAYVWRRFGIGVGVTRFATSTRAVVTGSIPHPFFFSRPRTLSGDVGLDRTETAIHLSARALLPVGRRFEVAVFGGPSFFRVTQGVVTDVSYLEAFPYDSVALDRTDTIEAKASRTAFNLGADVSYFFGRQVGVGFTAQLAPAQVDVPGVRDGEQRIDVGGLQWGGGLRVRF
jgi:hypothetical protein